MNLSLLTRYWPDQATTRDIARQERLLLSAAGVFVFLSQFGLMLARGDAILLFWPVIVWLICAAALHAALTVLLPNRDPVLLPIVMMLAGWGLVLIARLAPPFTSRQLTSSPSSCHKFLTLAIYTEAKERAGAGKAYGLSPPCPRGCYGGEGGTTFSNDSVVCGIAPRNSHPSVAPSE